jgi:hypothetical protein
MAMVMIVASEGIFMLKDGIHPKRPEFLKQLVGYGVLVAACFVLVKVDSLSKPHQVRPLTIEEARVDPDSDVNGVVAAGHAAAEEARKGAMLKYDDPFVLQPLSTHEERPVATPGLS